MLVHLRRLGLVIAIVLAISGVAVAVHRATSSDWPAHWDKRVLPYVRFVERERGLRFRHPVETDFLADAAFNRRVGGTQKLSADDVAQLHQYEGIFRALGLVSGNVDLRKATEQLDREEIIGLYDPRTRHVYVRGDHITLSMQPTIVHELTHALQAQHFDIDPHIDSSSAQTAFRSLVEADAMRVEDAYVHSLSRSDQDEIDKDEQAQAKDVDLTNVPPILTELFSFPYVLGPAFVTALDHDGGIARINHAFHDRPTTEQQIAEPSQYLRGIHPVKVAEPSLRAGETKVGDTDDFGMISLLLVLGQRVPFATSWDAVKDWRGDSSVTYRANGLDCIRIRVEMGSTNTADRLTAALRTWALARTKATVDEDGRDVLLSSCDPGTSTSNTDIEPRPFDVLHLRAELITVTLEGGLSESDAECTADAVIRDHDPAQLLEVAKLDDDRDPRIRQLQRDISNAVTRCRTRATS
jgi:hypothetical protein